MKHIRFGLLIFLIVLLTGCMKIPIGDGETIEISKGGLTMSDSEGNETMINLDKDEGQLTISNEEGADVSVGVNATIPEKFPSDIPIPKGAIVISGVTLDDESKNSTSVTYLYEGEFEEIVTLYKDYFSNREFDSILDSDTNEDIATVADLYSEGGMEVEMMNVSKGDENYIVQIRSDEKEGNVTVSIIHSISVE